MSDQPPPMHDQGSRVAGPRLPGWRRAGLLEGLRGHTPVKCLSLPWGARR